MKIANMTPHEVNIVDSNGNVVYTFPSMGLARCAQKTERIGEVRGIPISTTVFGEVYGLPEPDGETMYIVSRLVLSACPDRPDLLVPNELVRDEQGNIVGCKSLSNN